MFAMAGCACDAAIMAQKETGNWAVLATNESVGARARLIEIRSDWQSIFAVPAAPAENSKSAVPQQRTVDLRDLVFWGSASDDLRLPVIVLQGGDQVAGHLLSLDGGKAVFESPIWRKTTIATDLVSAVLFNVDEDRRARDLWLDRLDELNAKDRIWFHDGDFVETAINSLSKAENELVASDGEKELVVNLERVKAIVFGREAGTDARSSASAVVSTIDGSNLYAGLIAVEDGDLVIHGSGFQLRTKPQPSKVAAWQLICGITSRVSSFVSLTDLKPFRYEHTPFFQGRWQYRMNRSVIGTRIRSDDNVFENGIGMHAKSNLVFQLDRPFKRLDFSLAMDPSTHDKGSVTCRVLALDPNNQWQVVYQGDTIRGSRQLVHGSADLNESRAVALAVDFADRGDMLDRVNWINPRLIK